MTVATPAPPTAHEQLPSQIDDVTLRIASEPRNAVLFLRRGELHRLHGDFAAASKDYDEAARLDPSLHAVDLGRALLLHEWGREEEALTAVDRFLSNEPERADGLVLRAELLAVSGRLDEAVREMDGVIGGSVNSKPDDFLQRARYIQSIADLASDARSRRRHLDRAIAGLDDGMERLGPVVSLQLLAVELETARGTYDRAIERLDALSSQYGRSERLLARRGNVLEAAGRFMDAQVAYTEAFDAIEALPAPARRSAAVKELESYVRQKLRTERSLEEEQP